MPARCDLVLCDADGIEFMRVQDVPVDPSRGEVAITEPIDGLRKLGVATFRSRLVAVEESGDRILGEYTFNHTPYSPT